MSVLLHMPTLYLCNTISASNPLRTVYTCIMQVAARKQPPCPSNTRHWFRQFLVIYHCLNKGGGVRGTTGNHILLQLTSQFVYCLIQCTEAFSKYTCAMHVNHDKAPGL